MRNVLAAVVVGLALGCGGEAAQEAPAGNVDAMGNPVDGTTGGGTTTGDPSGSTGDPTGGGAAGGDPAVNPTPTAGSEGGGATTPIASSCALCPECDANCLYPDIRGTGSCADLDTGFPGDEACLPVPEPGDGIQIHVGPADYANPGDYVFGMGESSQCKDFVTPNAEDVFYQGWVISARTGTHHVIDTCFSTPVNPAGGFGACRNLGIGSSDPGSFGIPGASKPYMPRAPVAPENAGLGARLPASSQCQADMHYFNFAPGTTLLRELWLNLYTKPADQITAEAAGIRGMGGFSWNLAPIPTGTDKVYKYAFPPAAPTTDDARIVMLLGHYHAHGERFTAFLNGEKVFEMFDYNEPLIFYYNSVTQNPAFAPDLKQGGASSGMLPIRAGDVLSWECHIINDSTVALRYVNEVETGEMCNLWGSTVGVKFDWVEPIWGTGQ